MKKARSLKQVNEAIKKVFPKVELVKGNGYFYIASDDKKWGLKIAGLYTTSIPVAKISQQTVAQWVKDVDDLLMDSFRNY